MMPASRARGPGCPSGCRGRWCSGCSCSPRAFHRLLGLLIVLLVAFFIALAMEPAVGALARRGMARGLATALVFLGTFACVPAFLAAVVTLLVETTTNLAHESPRLLDDGIAWLNRTFGQQFTTHELSQRLLRESDLIEGYARTAADKAWGVSTTVLGGLVQLLTIALFSIYLTAGGQRVRRTVCSLLPPARQHRAAFVVRPDGYLGCVAPTSATDDLLRYFAMIFAPISEGALGRA
ncbi:AI-2E family transporter [Nocardia rhizosphaerae]|uniref:AI-2E family transporter n=1 Tax=Nocardia rhizosphaerae TaxID=1691571 RepID=A0ABV8LC60_9NOCA